jgi:hypothetical protein
MHGYHLGWFLALGVALHRSSVLLSMYSMSAEIYIIYVKYVTFIPYKFNDKYIQVPNKYIDI